MDHVLTVGDILWPLLLLGGSVLAIGLGLAVLAFFANAMKD
jgi:hypothetical protein